MIKELKQFINKHKFISLLLLIVFILRLPSLFEPYWYGDEGVYLTVGMAIRKGFLLYRDIFDNKPPLIYLLTGLANASQFWFRFFLLAFLLPAIYFFYRLALLIFEKKQSYAKISTIIFALLTTARVWEGNIANAELFILLPTIIGIYWVWKNLNLEKKNYFVYFLAGSILALGFLFKAVSLFDFAALMVFLVFFPKKKLFSFGKQELFLIAGYLTPIILTSFYFLLKGTFPEFYSACFLQMFGYLSSWKTGTHAFSLVNLFKSELMIKFIFTGAIVLVLWSRKKHFSPPVLFSFLWFIFSLFSATLSGRPYPHYLIQTIPPLSLILIQFVSKNKQKIAMATAAFVLLIFSFIHYRFWAYPTLSYYQNFLEFSLGKKNKTDYFAYFNPNLDHIYQTAEFIMANTNPEDKIFVWADEPFLYVLSKRLPATPYVVAYHITDLGNKDIAIQKLQQNSAKTIVVDNQTPSFPQLKAILDNNYIKLQQIGNFAIFRQRILLSPFN